MDDDFWDDDGIDDAMLIAASQMVETKGEDRGGGKRDSLDDATLSMLIREVENDPEDLDSKPFFEEATGAGPSTNRFLQTQTVFKPSQSSRGPPGLMPPPKPKSQKPTPATSGVRNANQQQQIPLAQFKELEAENVRLNKEKSSKMGEISVLREELRKRKAELDAERVAKTRLMEAKAHEIKAKEEEAKTKIDQAVTERDFLSHELDRTKEDLKRMAKSHKLMSKMQSQQPSQGPDPKRPRVTSPQRHTLTSRGAASNIPKSIDRTLLGLKEEPTAKSEAVPQIDTKETGCQTEGRAKAKRKDRGRLCLDQSLASTVQRLNKVTLDDPEAQKASFLLSAALSVTSRSDDDDRQVTTGDQQPGSDPGMSEDMVGAMANLVGRGAAGKLSLKILLEQSGTNPAFAKKIVDKVKEVVQAEVRSVMDGNKALDTEIIDNGLCVLAILVKQHFRVSSPERFQLLSFIGGLLTSTTKNNQLSDKESPPVLSSLTHVRLSMVTSVFTFLKKGGLNESLCSPSQGAPCFLESVCFCLSEEMLETSLAQVSAVESDSAFGGSVNKYERLAQEVVGWATNAFLVQSDQWLAKNTCQSCRRDVTKILALCCWCVVARATKLAAHGTSNSQDGTQSDSGESSRLGSLERVFKQCSTLCLHRLKLFDEVTYVRSLAENPVIQRRYIWSFKQGLARLKSKFNITPAEEVKLSDLSVESDLSLSEDKKAPSRPPGSKLNPRTRPK